MQRHARSIVVIVVAAVTALFITACATAPDASSPPNLHVDATWPKPLPHGWILGAVAGVAVDADDHVWVLQRPGTLTDDERGATFKPPLSACCAPAPSVLEFDASGNLLRSWGGPATDHKAGYDWPQNEHGIHVDAAGYVWITGNGEQDGQLLKFTRDGRFVMQIGKVGPQTGNLDTSRLGQAAGVEVDGPANEVYVADGYYNKRVIVFDATTGAFKRMWSAFGKPPTDAEKPNLRRTAPPTETQLATFGNPVHCVRIARDGLVYVCDRLNDRVQVFQEGRHVREAVRDRAGHGGQRVGLGHRTVARRGSALDLSRGRSQQSHRDVIARDRRGGRDDGSTGTLCRRVPLGARPRDRLPRERVCGRGGYGETGAEVRAGVSHEGVMR